MEFSSLNWQAAAGLFALLAGSLLLPQLLLPFAALIFLYFLPGYVITKLIKPGLGNLAEFALSILLSVMASTYAIYFLALLLGYSSTTFFLFFALCSLAAIFVKELPQLSTGKGETVPALLAAATAVIFFAILYFSLWVPSSSGIITGGWNYGDFFLHSSVMQSVNSGNFPPQEPIYSGEPLAYHWFIDLHTAILAKLLGVFASGPAIFDSTIGVCLLSLLTYLLAFHFTKNQRVSLLAAFLLIFAGGFGYLRLFDEIGKAPLSQLLAGDAFDNKGEFFQLPSMLPGFLLAQRPLTIGLPAFATVLLLVASGYPSDRRKLLLAGIVLGMMPPFQYYAFLAAALCSALYFAYSHVSQRSLKGVENSAFVILPSLLLASPFLLSALGRAGGMTKLGLGWLAPKTGAYDFIKFYAGNFGLAFLLAFPGFFLIKSKAKLFLALSILLLFTLPNLITFSNTQWDMGKFFILMMLPASILAAAAIAKLYDWIIPAVLLFCCLSPILGSVFYLSCGWTGLTYEEMAAGAWIQQNTPELSIFASSSAHNTPIDSVAGRLRILGYRWWVTNYGLDYDSRFSDLRQLYCDPSADRQELMRKYNATYAYLSPKEAGEYGCRPSFENSPGFTLAYSSRTISIYKFSG